MARLRGAVEAARLQQDGVLLLAVGMLVITAKIHARRRGITAWNSLATRMFASQLPLAIAGALLTVGLALERQVSFVPAIWLLLYGVIEFSFSYFSGRDHQVVGIGFLGLGAAALFGPGTWGLPLLGVGFGGLHIALGTFRMVRGKAK